MQSRCTAKASSDQRQNSFIAGTINLDRFQAFAAVGIHDSVQEDQIATPVPTSHKKALLRIISPGKDCRLMTAAEVAYDHFRFLRGFSRGRHISQQATIGREAD